MSGTQRSFQKEQLCSMSCADGSPLEPFHFTWSLFVRYYFVLNAMMSIWWRYVSPLPPLPYHNCTHCTHYTMFSVRFPLNETEGESIIHESQQFKSKAMYHLHWTMKPWTINTIRPNHSTLKSFLHVGARCSGGLRKRASQCFFGSKCNKHEVRYVVSRERSASAGV